MLIPNFAFKIFIMSIYCCCLHKVNKLVEIKNAPRDLLTNVIKAKQVCCLRISNMNFDGSPQIRFKR